MLNHHPKRNTRRALMAQMSALSVVAPTAAILASCAAGGRDGAQKGEAGLSGPVTVTLWDREEAIYQQFMDAWVPRFNEAHQKVKVVYEPRPPSWGEKLTTAIVGGTPPDTVAVFGSWFRTLQQEGQALPLDKYIKAANLDVTDFLQGVYRGMSWESKQIGIPQYVNTNTVYYNRDHFQRNGIPLPANDWTHDHFLEAARKLTRGSLPQREVWGVSVSWNSITGRAASLLWGQCGSYNDPKNINVFTFNTPQNVKAFQWVHDIPWKYRLAPVNNQERGGVGQSDA
ncbi:MAG TPA: extracellular solute-binding protein, partial [Chloroflexota bacterium]|nr:extracellular solute-binding protein [Chloroflexota bacterium]